MSELNAAQKEAVGFAHTAPAVVTAAAGSGKTTLLVERVIRLLSDRELGIKADTLGVMTFTRNATKSMREKLNNALSKRIEKLADDDSDEAREERAYLGEQIFALRQASISTIDSFCLKMIRENPEAFDLPINFTIADAAKKTALQTQALKMTMQDFYDDGLTGAHAFSEEERRTLFYTFDFENDRALENALISTAEELSSYADADGWLDKAASVYVSEKSLEEKYIHCYEPLLDFRINQLRANAGLYDEIRENLIPETEEILGGLEHTAKNKSKLDGIHKFIDIIAPSILAYIDEDMRRMKIIEKHYADFRENKTAASLSAFFAAVGGFGNNPVSVDMRSGTRTVYRKLFTTAKNGFADIIEGINNYSFDNSGEEAFQSQQLVVRTFVKLLRVYREYLDSAKKAAGCVDFSDCELLLLEKLRSDESFCKQLSERFSCIIVDEFQDSNDIQAEIFRLLGKGRQFYVGDVKQSIYAFRGGNPSIMANLKETEGFTELPLNINYRSRQSVIDTVNAAFTGLMTREHGGVDYAHGHELKLGAAYPDIPEQHRGKYSSEIIALNSAESADEDRDMACARFVAAKIKSLHDDENFLVTRDGVPERCRYSDFAILLRSKTKIACYRKALEELGIGSAAPKGRNFLEAEEIALVINYLKIVDNPLKDEEMLKVLMSPIYRFTAEEAAQLRLGTLGTAEEALTEKQAFKVAKACKKYSLYNCLRVCSKPLELADFDENETAVIPREINPKLARFTADLNLFRYRMGSDSLENLIRTIYEDTDIIAVVAAFEDSAGRVSNIRALQRLASDFAARDGGSLSDFLRFVDRARENAQGGIEEAARPETAEDAVQIMTFHGSKGLEVPVCIMAELQNPMNRSDFTGTLLVNRDDYMAFRHVDIKNRLKSKTFAYNAVERSIRKKLCGEELRLLYVAMTRAQEKLIMVGKFNLKKLCEEKFDPNFPEETFEKTTPFRWVMSALMAHAPEDTADGEPIKLDGIDCVIYEATADGAAPVAEETADEEYVVTDEESAALAALMNERYPYADETRQQAKFTVTELAHQKSVRPVNLTAPSFAVGGRPSGAEKGNAYHHTMQHLPLESIDGSETAVGAAIEELVKRGKITAREAEIVEKEHIARFFQSELGQRMLKSSEIVREKPFYAEICGRDVGQDYDGRISIQGQIDLYFVEEDGIVVVDYKSDTVTNLEEERENYAKQVKIYSKILPEFTGKPIKEMYLYAFLADKAIEI